MTEKTFEKQVPKEGFQTANGKYMGHDEEPISGETKGKAWRKTKLRFLLEGKEKENKFVLWTPIKTPKTLYKSDEELKQFGMYKITWVEEAKAHDGNEWVEKRITMIDDEGEIKEKPAKTNTSKQYPISKFTKICIGKLSKTEFPADWGLYDYVKLYAKVSLSHKDYTPQLMTEQLLQDLQDEYEKEIDTPIE